MCCTVTSTNHFHPKISPTLDDELHKVGWASVILILSVMLSALLNKGTQITDGLGGAGSLARSYG